MRKLVIPLEMAGLRLDRALALMLPEESRSRLSRAIVEGQVLVGGRVVAGAVKVKSGESVEVALEPRGAGDENHPEAIDLVVIHEDEDVLVIDKPAGLVVHPGSGNRAGTLLNALLHHAPTARELPRAGIVHRLDKDTSGIMVVAKTEAAQLALVRQLQARTVKRTYLALVRGVVKAAGKVDAPIGRHPVHRTRMAVVAGGKPAVTHYRIRKRFARHTLLECDLETGRTHQIRVHLASIGHALEGDAAYAGRARRGEGAPLMHRQALHAWKLAFEHPRTAKAVRFEAAPPADLEALLATLGR